MNNCVTNSLTARQPGSSPLPPERVRRNRVVAVVTDSGCQQPHSGAEQGNTSVAGFVLRILRQVLAHKIRINEGEKPWFVV